MEDLTIEQVREIATKYYPENVEEVMAAFSELQAQSGLNNYETVLLVQKQMQADHAELVPEQQPQAGAEQPARLDGLRAKFGL